MDNARFVLIVFFFLLGMMLFQQWQVDHGLKPPVTAAQGGLEPPANPDVPGATPAATDDSAPVAADSGEALTSRQRISVETDVVRMEVDTEGGDIRQLELLHRPCRQGCPG